MFRIEKRITAFCDDCGDSVYTVDIQKEVMEGLLRKAGWSFRENKLRCPIYTAKNTAEKAKKSKI